MIGLTVSYNSRSQSVSEGKSRWEPWQQSHHIHSQEQRKTGSHAQPAFFTLTQLKDKGKVPPTVG